ncbi:MAG TPA: hypothetical protein VGC13_16185 [Longimicrobium sp.]|jgi:hypothetical protein|uniref:hypothetical protein n=1 Tax=Longimicrobium sp. TaxID=2029185 RepID=UPI002ED7F949
MTRFNTSTHFAGGVAGDPMEEVLVLQSYSLDRGKVADFCISDRSIVIDCPSWMSSSEEIAM